MKNKRYIVRADGNARIGVGHLMRCLTIMEALSEILGGREEILFLCAEEQSAQLVEKRGFQAYILHTDYDNMEAELPLWEQLFAADHNAPDSVSHDALDAAGDGAPGTDSRETPGKRRILVDSYSVTDYYLEKLSSYGKVFLLDDMQKKKYPVDAVINYNAFAEREAYERLYARSGTELYIGSSFVPLRSQFRKAMRPLSDNVTDVLITTGGSDKDNIAGQILDRIYREDMRFHLVVGSLSPYFQELKQLEKQKKGVVLHHNVQDMAGLMRKCDLAVTAGGSTVYELAAAGVPFICFSYAENQEALVSYTGREKIAAAAGAFHKEQAQTMENIKRVFDDLCDSRRLREAYRSRAQQMADCKGAYRLAEALSGVCKGK